MTTDPRPWDVTELDAGNARGFPPEPTLPDPGTVQAIREITSVGFMPSGDLDRAASVLGVDVADLVKLRRQLGVATSHRRPSRWTRLFRKG